MNQHEWLMNRNCCLTPRQLGGAYLILCMSSFGVALLFALRGAWPVMAYSMLEMMVLALAFVHFARHANDHEHIVLQEGCLLIERVQAGEVEQIRLDPYWTRIAAPHKARDMINLESKGIKIEVGRYVTEAKRRQVAHELRQQLRGGLFC